MLANFVPIWQKDLPGTRNVNAMNYGTEIMAQTFVKWNKNNPQFIEDVEPLIRDKTEFRRLSN